jgi:hypothetical protein
MNDAKPSLLFAAICEDVLKEKGGTLTLFRLIDGATASQEPTPERPATVSFQLVVKMLRNGFVGEQTIYVTCRIPGGEESDTPDVGEACMTFREPFVVVATICINFQFGAMGTFWFDVFLGDERLVSVPFVVGVPNVDQKTG